MTKEPILIAFHEQHYNSNVRQLEAIGSHLSAVIDFFNSHFSDIEKITRLEQVVQLLTNAREYIFQQKTNGKELSIAGIKISEEKAREILALPAEVAQLETMIEKLVLLLTTERKPFHDYAIKRDIKLDLPVGISQLSAFFQLDSHHKFVVTENRLQSIKAKFSDFISSDQAQAVYEVLTILKEKVKISSFPTLSNKNDTQFFDFLQSLLTVKEGELEIDKNALASYDRDVKRGKEYTNWI